MSVNEWDGSNDKGECLSTDQHDERDKECHGLNRNRTVTEGYQTHTF